jgi:NAD+ synthetase
MRKLNTATIPSPPPIISSYGWAQLNYTIGDFNSNADKISNAYLSMAEKTDWVVFSELCLSGYYPHDLLTRNDFMQQQTAALLKLQQLTVGKKAWMVVGGVQKNTSGVGKEFMNGLWILGDGMIQATYQKQLLPTYNIFDERRHFEPGNTSLIVRRAGQRVGFVICEDAWNLSHQEYAADPVEKIAAQGVDIIVSLNASPSNVGKAKQRQELMQRVCNKYQTSILYVNQVGVNDEIVFDGGSFSLNKHGLVHFSAPICEEATGVLYHSTERSWFTSEPSVHVISDVELTRRHAVTGLRDYMSKQGFKKVVVGSSGGIDSALTLALAVEALGAECVTAITMPSQYSSTGSVSDSVALCNNLNVNLLDRAIEDEVQLAIKNFTNSFGSAPSVLTIENIQARIRGRILMEYSNNFGALVLSTGNKSEMSVGYATLYGDMNGGINLIGDLYKMEVYALSEHLNKSAGVEIIPQAIIDKAPSAELRPGQRDDDTLPPYPLLDAILRRYVETSEVSESQWALDETLISSTSKEVIKNVLALVDKNEFKRRQAPPIIRMHARSFGRGRQMPIVHKFAASLQP